ncbi:ATP synthase subunit beta [Mesorhizobium sp. Root157]|uniref:class I SAM-dependent methyltransferase n=1 Tax=Mesorhizobium sp. Root157 TaxID=1736477 RepID=UPI0006FDF9AC|nr:class I SAM-dependent methyltransferase [Mesorhizobium sp. Root157]KQZ87265.1 ATP synthase subunit beta [Mesorhizobium sp. Root157]
MTRLKQRIAELIGTLGPIPVSEYMALCLFDPREGYYTTREPFGAAGDFITAPEVSQMFGELIAVWLYQAWSAIGRPMPVTLAEIGPGRGTLMKDMLRTFERLDPAFFRNAAFAMIEASPRLAETQKQTLASMPANVSWHESIVTLPPNPLLIVGNELFDAVPIRQFVRKGVGWRERMVGLSDNDDLAFFSGVASLDPSLLPEDAHDAPEGTIVEIAPARSALMDLVAARVAADGGAGLFIDYGHLEPGVGDTLQAMKDHAYQDVLASPGEADLTAHVDFAALAETARAHGLSARLATQGDFLLTMGLLERAGRLGANADDAVRGKISGEVERLAGASQMGDLFKVLAILSKNAADVPFPAKN